MSAFIMEILPAIIVAIVTAVLGWELDRRGKKRQAILDRQATELKSKLDQETNRLSIALQDEVEARQRHEQRGDLARDVAIDEIGNIVGSLAKIAGRAKDLPEGQTFTIPIPPELHDAVKVEQAA